MLRVHCAVLNARTRQLVHTRSQSYGGHGERETPGPIPNPEAKPLSADGTALETGWESRTPPDNHSRRGPSIRAGAPFGMPGPGSAGTSRPGRRLVHSNTGGSCTQEPTVPALEYGRFLHSRFVHSGAGR